MKRRQEHCYKNGSPHYGGSNRMRMKTPEADVAKTLSDQNQRRGGERSRVVQLEPCDQQEACEAQSNLHNQESHPAIAQKPRQRKGRKEEVGPYEEAAERPDVHPGGQGDPSQAIWTTH